MTIWTNLNAMKLQGRVVWYDSWSCSVRAGRYSRSKPENRQTEGSFHCSQVDEPKNLSLMWLVAYLNIFDHFGAECRVRSPQGFGFVEFRDAGVREAADLQDELMQWNGKLT